MLQKTDGSIKTEEKHETLLWIQIGQEHKTIGFIIEYQKDKMYNIDVSSAIKKMTQPNIYFVILLMTH